MNESNNTINGNQINRSNDLEFEKQNTIKTNILEPENKLNKNVEKTEWKEMNKMGLFGTPVEPRKSLNSFLRNQNKLLVNAMAIFDRKAAILIRICSAIITGLIAFHEYIDMHVVNGYSISIVLIIGLLISLMLALLATKPHNLMGKWIYNKYIKPSHPTLKENLVVMIESPNLEAYQMAMKEVVNSQDLQLGNQIRANYLLSMNNKFDALLLGFAYNTFMLSVIAAGVIFLLSRFAIL